MSLIDRITELFKGGDSGKYQAVLKWIIELGGVQVLLDKFQQQGFGPMVASWLSGEGANHPVDTSQIKTALGMPAITLLAEKLGVDSHQASEFLAKHLPTIIDALTPEGKVQAGNNHDLLTQGLKLLKGKLFS